MASESAAAPGHAPLIPTTEAKPNGKNASSNGKQQPARRGGRPPTPPYRRLRGYAFDPSLSIELETAVVNDVIFKVRWEPNLAPGPIGEYVEVVDYDPASQCFYEPVDLNDHLILAQDGLPPSEGNPKFHQQMVYAVVMTTIKNFEQALGRRALWAPRQYDEKTGRDEQFVEKLRIYPHALREANAYYSPAKKALLFGYFPASAQDAGSHFPGGVVFTCLAHDIVAHETSHALLDGMHRRYIEATSPDGPAFHEAFADMVALFQRFSFREVLLHQIAKTRGDLTSQNLLGELAQQFGKSTGRQGALRSALGKINAETGKWEKLEPNPDDLRTTLEAHKRGAILVAAVFDAFLSIYTSRVRDLMRIASNGTGVLAEGALHPDLVGRLADEAVKSAQHVLNVCVRALDYCPPVDVTFGEFLRAIITADSDIVHDDDKGYRVAFIEAFRRRGVYPQDVRTLSEDSLRWPLVEDEEYGETFKPACGNIMKEMRGFTEQMRYLRDRKEIYDTMAKGRAKLHELLKEKLGQFPEEQQMKLVGMLLTRNVEAFKGMSLEDFECDKHGLPKFEVHTLRPMQRAGPDGNLLNQVVVTMTQKRKLNSDGSPGGDAPNAIVFRGGCTLIFDLDTLDLRYHIVKPIHDPQRWQRQLQYVGAVGGSLRATYFGAIEDSNEPFALLHRDYEDD